MTDSFTHRSLARLDAFLTANPDLYLRVACPSLEYSASEMAHGVGRWFAVVRGLWESLTLGAEPDLALVMLQAPPVDAEVLNYLFELLRSDGDETLTKSNRHTLINLADYRDCHLSDKFLQAPDLVADLRTVIRNARDRGQHVQGLSCFASSQRMAELASVLELDLLETPTDTLPCGTKAGSRRIFRQAGVRHAAGSYTARYSVQELASDLSGLAADGKSERWLVKLNEGFGSGHGNAAVQVSSAMSLSEIVAELRYGLDPVCPDIPRADFLAHVPAVGAIVEEYMTPIRAGSVRFPSVLGYLTRSPDADAQVEILGTHEQIISNSQEFVECYFPAESAYRSELLDISGRIFAELARGGARGHVGVDFIARSVPGSPPWRLDPTEVNLRQTGTTHFNRIVRAVVAGDWRADGLLVDQAGRPVYYSGTDNLVEQRYRGIPVSVLIAALRADPVLSYDPALSRGVVPSLWTTLEPFGKIGATFIGRSAADCAELREQFVGLLDGLAGSR